jgi:NTP pyrophosphatase (non-canonical NTP hydrolase)
MFRKIYPGNTLSTSTTHLFEEVAEVVESVQHFTASHAQEVLENLRIELVDVAANLFAVATCSNISLTDTVRKMFANGCLRCHKRPCRCGFTVSDDDPPFVF